MIKTTQRNEFCRRPAHVRRPDARLIGAAEDLLRVHPQSEVAAAQAVPQQPDILGDPQHLRATRESTRGRVRKVSGLVAVDPAKC